MRWRKSQKTRVELKDGTPKIITVHVCVIALIYAVEVLLTKDLLSDSMEKIMHVLVGGISGCVILRAVWKGHLLRKNDFWICISFFLYIFGVTVLYNGFSYHLLYSKFYFHWINVLCLFFAVRAEEKPDDVLRPFSLTYVLAILLQEIVILIHATCTLTEEIPGSDRMWGCFRVGRLCGMSNANTMSFHCMTVSLFSIVGWMKGKRKARIFYGMVLFFQWFLMGMANCRTTIYSLTFAIALFAMALVRKGLTEKGKKAALVWSAGILSFIVTFFLMAGSFMLPTLLYRGGVTCVAKMTQNQRVLDNLSLVYERNVTDVDTLLDRKQVWNRSLELIFKNPRRALLGISVHSTEKVNDAYEGRYDIPATFAHNSLLEIIRRLGLIGLCFWLTLLCLWGKRALSIYFDVKKEKWLVFLAAGGAGALLTGVTEMGPFFFKVVIAIPLFLFICCGYCMRDEYREKN